MVIANLEVISCTHTQAFFFSRCVTLYLSTLDFIHHFITQPLSITRLFSNSLQLALNVNTQKMLRNHKTCHSLHILFSRQMNTLNSTGPSIVHYCISLVIPHPSCSFNFLFTGLLIIIIPLCKAWILAEVLRRVLFLEKVITVSTSVALRKVPTQPV